MKITKENRERVKALCKTYNVETLYLFGSVTNDNFSEKSDIDLLVQFKKIDLARYFMNYITLKEKLKSILKREIDLIEEQTLKNPILIKSINKNKELIYG